jgi:hypothetical protein
VTRLTDRDRRTIAEAREVAEVRTRDIAAWTGETSHAAAYAVALGRAQWRLNELLRLVDRLADDAEDTRRLAEIRAVLGRCDWEHDDRQLALEAVERIADGGPA